MGLEFEWHRPTFRTVWARHGAFENSRDLYSSPMRSLVVLLIAALLVTTIVSGLLAFLLPFDLGVTRVHAVAAPLLALLLSCHVYHHRRAMLRSFSGQCRKQQLVAVLVMGVIAAVLYLDVFPASTWMDQSYEKRQAHLVFRPSRDVVTRRLNGCIEIKRLNKQVTLLVEAALASGSNEARDRVAVWMEDEEGHLLDTLYLSEQLRYSDTVVTDGATEYRRDLLPLWWHRWEAQKEVASAAQGADALSGATTRGGFDFAALVEDGRPRFQVMMEIARPGDAPQVFSVLIDLDRIKRHYLMDLLGLSTPRGTLSYDTASLQHDDVYVDRVLITIDRQAGSRP